MASLLCFDFDDTLFYTSGIIYKSYKKAIQKVIGSDELTWDRWYLKERGKYYRDFLDALDIDPSLFEQINEERKKLYPLYFNDIIPNRGLIQKVYDNYSAGGKNIIVTNATAENVRNILRYFEMDPNIFDLIIDRNYRDQDGNVRCKPDPYLYELFFFKFLSAYNHITIYEDSKPGIDAIASAMNSFSQDIAKYRTSIDIRIVNMNESS